MTKQELLVVLHACALESRQGDAEAAHGDADDALIAFINDKEISDAYAAIKKWYA